MSSKDKDACLKGLRVALSRRDTVSIFCKDTEVGVKAAGARRGEAQGLANRA